MLKMTAQALMILLYPMYAENLVASRTRKEVGMIMNSISMELVRDVTSFP